MQFHPFSESIGKDEVTYFSMVSSPNNEPLHQAIGRIAVEFGKLEYLVKVAIERLSRQIAARNGLQTEEIGFTEGMLQAEREHTFSACCVYLERLYRVWESDPERITAFEYLTSKLQEICKERNALLHSAWSSSDNETFLRLRSRYDSRTKTLQQSVERLELSDLDRFHKTVNWHWFLLCLSVRMEVGLRVPIAAPIPPIGPSRGRN